MERIHSGGKKEADGDLGVTIDSSLTTHHFTVVGEFWLGGIFLGGLVGSICLRVCLRVCLRGHILFPSSYSPSHSNANTVKKQHRTGK